MDITRAAKVTQEILADVYTGNSWENRSPGVAC